MTVGRKLGVSYLKYLTISYMRRFCSVHIDVSIHSRKQLEEQLGS